MISLLLTNVVMLVRVMKYFAKLIKLPRDRGGESRGE